MKIKFFLLLALVSLLSSCESNNSNNLNITTADLIGSWNLSKQTIEDGSFTISSQGQTLTATYSGLAKNINFTYTFSENPNELTLNGNYKFVTTATFLGQPQVEEQIINTDLLPITSAKWSLNGDTITFVEDNDLPTVMNIVEFSQNYIKMVGEIDETETDGSESISIKATLVIELKR